MHKENYPIAFPVRFYNKNAIIFFMHMVVELCKFVWI